MPLARIAAVLVASALALASVPAQDRGIETYREVVEQYRTASDAAIARMLAMDAASIDRAIHEATLAGSGWTPQDLDTAMMLHTDAGISLARERGAEAWAQIQHAQDLGDAAARDPENSWFVHQWYSAVSDTFPHQERIAVMRSRLQQQPWYRTAAALDLALLFELKGALGLMMPGDTFERRYYDREIYDSPEFTAALPNYAQALAGHLLIAAVHMGRIQMLRGRDAEARRLFEQAAGESRARTTRYLANLFVGSMDERAGRPDAAERRYRAAIADFPRAQSGRVALAALLARGGRSAEAATTLESESRPASYDPWWAYLPSDPRDAGAVLFAALRAEVCR